MRINKNFDDLGESYLFVDIKKRVQKFMDENPGREVIRLGIGDIVLPIDKFVTKEMARACKEQSRQKTVTGYGDERGSTSLRQHISGWYALQNTNINPDEVFISDGAKSDLGNILEVFEQGITVAIPDPVYPAYVDSNIISGNKIVYMNATEENGFLPMPSDDLKSVDIVYLCSPNNPTGAVYTREDLKQWVDFAIENDIVILFDAAYSHFIRDKKLPKSIYEIDNAKKCAVEVCSFSKMAGFTGLRCGWTVVPFDISNKKLNNLWSRRQQTKFNGASSIIQRGAVAVMSKQGQDVIKENIDYYMRNAEIIRDTLTHLGVEFFGGENAPYIWVRCPEGMTSWGYFDFLLSKCGIVVTPGVGFGKNGEGWIRISAFALREKVLAAMYEICNT